MTSRLVLLSGALLATLYLSHRPSSSPSSSPFIPATLIHSVDVSHNSKLLTLSLPPQRRPRDISPISSIFVKESDIQVERPYTPLEGIDENGIIKLWVKKYEHGEVGRWLHSRKVGDAIEIRGPVKTWSSLWQNGPWDEVVMISGGTGITPFYQLLHSTFRTCDTTPATRFTLLHASSSSADLPPATVIQSLSSLSHKHPDRFQFRLFAGDANDPSHSDALNITRGRIGKSAVQDALRLTQSTPWWRSRFSLSPPRQPAPRNKILVLVCGPEGMINAIAGPYGRNYSQGQVGGILGELGLQSHQVWKL